VNHSAGDMEAEAEEPQNQYDDKDCPEHIDSFAAPLDAREEIHCRGRPESINYG
jgi:hypothetical protein